jgi:hypothetical protein
MIDPYYWQHSDRGLAASVPWWADLVGRYGGTKPSGRKKFVWAGTPEPVRGDEPRLGEPIHLRFPQIPSSHGILLYRREINGRI